MGTVNVNARLEPWMVQEIDKEAKELCTSRGAVIRMVIKQHVKEKYQKSGFNFERIKHLTGSVETGLDDLAQNHKKYLSEAFKSDK